MQSPDSQPTKFTAPLKVVPPQRQAPAPAAPTQNAPPPQDSPKGPIPSTLDPNSEDPLGWVKQSLKIGAVCVAVGAITLIPVGSDLRTSGSLQAKLENKANIYPPIAGKIAEISVQHNQLITPGTQIARMETPDIEEQILAEERRLQDYERQRNQYSEELLVARSHQIEAQQATRNNALNSQLLNQRATGASAEVERLNYQKSSISTRIRTVRNELISLEEEYRSQERILNRYLQANQDAGEPGAVITGHVIDEKQSKLRTVATLISNNNGELDELQHELSAKDAEITALRNNWREDAIRTTGQTMESEARESTMGQKLQVLQQQITDVDKGIQVSKDKLVELDQKRQEGQVVISKYSGRVLTSDFHGLLGRRMEENEAIIAIADTESLDVVIEVSQVDALEGLVEPGAKIEIRFPEGGSEIYDEIDSVDLELRDDPTGQKRLKIARATINNSAGQFSINQQVKVRIIGEKVPLYRKAWVEIRKHLPW